MYSLLIEGVVSSFVTFANIFALAIDSNNILYVAAEEGVHQVTASGKSSSSPGLRDVSFFAQVMCPHSLTRPAIQTLRELLLLPMAIFSFHWTVTFHVTALVGKSLFLALSVHLFIEGTPTIVYGSTSGGYANGVGQNAQFGSPSQLSLSTLGVMYVADPGNNNIRIIRTNGEVTLLAGSGGQSGNTDGPATVALFHGPQGIAVDSNGVVYVGDTLNNEIRIIIGGGCVLLLFDVG